MFEDFANVWTPVAFSSELRAGRPLALVLAGTRVVLFRDEAGRAVALLDRCPHRGVKLSLGKVKGGCIECPFHGWQLDGSGAVRHVPWNPDAKLDKLHGTALPARELAGQIWVHTSAGLDPGSEPTAHESLVREGVRVSGFSVEWETHWTRAMENMLDWPHLPFVHRATIGKEMAMKSGARMDVIWEERPFGAHTEATIDGEPVATTLDFRWPNQMNLHIAVPKRTLVMAAACVPIDASRTRMLLAVARDFLTNPLFDWFFNRMNARIAGEDQAIVESSSPAEIPPAGEERSVRTDGPTLAFRKRYLAELKGSSADGAMRGDKKRALTVAKAS